MMNHVDDTIRYLAGLGLAAPVYEPENLLHELCHAATLGLRPPHGRGLTPSIISAIGLLHSHLAADWNEVLTCAAEVRAAMLLGWDLECISDRHGGPPDLLTRACSGVLGGNVTILDSDDAAAKAASLVWSEASYRRARAALHAAEVTRSALPRSCRAAWDLPLSFGAR